MFWCRSLGCLAAWLTRVTPLRYGLGRSQARAGNERNVPWQGGNAGGGAGQGWGGARASRNPGHPEQPHPPKGIL